MGKNAFGRLPRVACVLACFSVAVATVPFPVMTAAHAEDARQAALAQQQRMRVLEARLQYLEEKLSKIERENIAAAEKQAQTETKGKKPNIKGGATDNALAPNAKKQGDQSPGSVASSSPASSSQSTTSPGTSQTPAAAAADAVKDSPAQETFAFRDQSPTLKKGQIEASLDVSYVHSSGFLQIDRVTTQAVSLRYGIIDGLEVAASLPHYDSVRTTQLGPGFENVGKADGIGGGTLGLSYSLLSETADWPGLAVSLAGSYPGSISPYGSILTPGKNPIDILRSVQSSGHWALGANVVAYKIVDPILVFAGGGPTYYFPKDYGGYSVEPAMRYSANMGFSFALTEKTTLAFQTIGLYQPNMKVGGVNVPQSYQEQYIARGALTVRVVDNTWVEPSLAMGLTKESPSMNVALTFRKRW